MPACASCGHTGWMHNRVRMIVASFLVKDLLHPLAGGRALVLGHAGRCRPRQQHGGLAVGRRLRRRRRALFPHLQSRAAGPEVRSRRRLCAELGARACQALRRPTSTRRGRPAARPRRGRGDARPDLSRRRSSITPRPAPGRSPPSSASPRTSRDRSGQCGCKAACTMRHSRCVSVTGCGVTVVQFEFAAPGSPGADRAGPAKGDKATCQSSTRFCFRASSSPSPSRSTSCFRPSPSASPPGSSCSRRCGSRPARRSTCDIARHWTKIFAVSFGMGVVSGVVLSYEFGTNWSELSRRGGNVIGPLMSYEVLTAFFLEAGFLGIMLFGWKRVPKWVHFFATCMVALGTAISAFWILSANSWMQTPAGFRVDDRRRAACRRLVAGDLQSVLPLSLRAHGRRRLSHHGLHRRRHRRLVHLARAERAAWADHARHGA